MYNNIIKKAKQNKVLRNGTIDGYTVAAIDGTKLFGSNKKSCIECYKTKTRNNHIHHFHNVAFMSLIGKEPRLIIDFEMYKGTEDSSKGNRHERILSLVPEIKRGHILFSRQGISYNNQIKDYYKFAKNDDAPDSLYGAVQLVQGV